MAQFRKNKTGEWVVFGTVSEVKVGPVTVDKKGGARNTVNVVSLGKPFYADGKQMVYGYIGKPAPKAAPKPVAADDCGDYDLDGVKAEMAAEYAAEMAAEADLSGCDIF